MRHLPAVKRNKFDEVGMPDNILNQDTFCVLAWRRLLFDTKKKKNIEGRRMKSWELRRYGFSDVAQSAGRSHN